MSSRPSDQHASLDQARERFEALAAEVSTRKDEIETEQDARFQVIDRILTEVLGWPRSAIRTEPPTESGFIDYLLFGDGRGRLVVEAKRTSTALVNTKYPHARWYKAGGPAVQSAEEGLQQAKRYATDSAVLFTALTNGFQWIGFWAVRTDGIPPSSGHVAVFPSFEAIRRDFALFHDLFSRDGIMNELFKIHVHEAEGLRIQHSEVLTAVIPSTDVYMLPKSPLAADLEPVFRRFFSTIAGDDPEMLAKCFVESKESREADDNLEKITKSLLNTIDVVDASKGERLQQEIMLAVESGRGEFVLIVGNKGAGKTTFIDRFFRLVLEPSLRKRCLLVRIDLADSPGEFDSIPTWLTNRLKEQLEIELFESQYPSYEQLQGVFFQEYDRWRHGERKFLYERNKAEFKERFGEWLADLIERDPALYVKRLMESTVRQRRRMPCLVFDNTDHFPQHFQEAVFQYAQSLYRSIFSFIICPITDRTIWQLSKAGPLQSYESRAFYLPVPSTKEVLAKRVAFIKSKVDEGDRSGSYFLEKGIRVSIRDIDAFTAVVEDIFLNEEYIGRVVGWHSNHDIRRSLKIAERIITSPTITVTDMVKAYLGGTRLRPRPRQIKLALLRGQHNHFMQDGSDFVVDLFAVRSTAITSPFLRLSILRTLIDKHSDSEEGVNAYLRISDLVNYFEPAGISGAILRDHVQALLSYRLIQPYDPTDMAIADDLLVRVTHSGRIHYEFAFERQEGSYVTEMALTTPIRRNELVDLVRSRLKSGKSLVESDWQQIRGVFMQYCLEEDEIFFTVPSTPSYTGQRAMRDELRSIWGEGVAKLGQEELLLVVLEDE